MKKERDNKALWNHYAGFYDFEINRFSGRAYSEMYRMMAASLTSDMDVLEVATGTGLIATHIAGHVRQMFATDYSPKMIKAASRKKAADNICFSLEDATALSFGDAAFDAVIICNALHVMPDPILVLSNISRVLKPKGLLIAPSYTHGHISDIVWNRNVRFLKWFGFESGTRWTPDEYVAFIRQNDFDVKTWQVLRAAFPLVYLEANKKD